MVFYKGNCRKGEIEILEEREVFKNRFATLNNDLVRFPSGEAGEYLRFRWNAPYGVMVFAQNEEGDLLLVRNFRHETRAWHWEIPKGFGIEGVKPLDCAKAELQEETGYTGNHWSQFRQFQHAEHVTYLYRCTIGEYIAINQEHSEAIAEARLFNKAECKTMMMDDHQVTDATTLFLMAYLQQAEE
ncbi:NUDIX hydrolase [Methylophaga sp.]|uniref:NUDIX hydrolase n=1 Tax=Methylophaga sp. TaxID=2024840 RepID=UPI003A8E3F2D